MKRLGPVLFGERRDTLDNIDNSTIHPPTCLIHSYLK